MRFILGLLIGAALGAAVAMLAGSETRQHLQQRVHRSPEEPPSAS